MEQKRFLTGVAIAVLVIAPMLVLLDVVFDVPDTLAVGAAGLMAGLAVAMWSKHAATRTGQTAS